MLLYSAFLLQSSTTCEFSKKTARINYPPCYWHVSLSDVVCTVAYQPLWIKMAKLGSSRRSILSYHHCIYVSLQELRICKLAVMELVCQETSPWYFYKDYFIFKLIDDCTLNANVIKYRNLNLGGDFIMDIYTEMHVSLWTPKLPRDSAVFAYLSYVNWNVKETP